ncbi:hypothetical protein FVEG_12120 [Fusarium verticillioides 7600]|uniref:Uncharacterized protein n=1 Tax=Gibberella moniliformis (strain M3125 / FGSC 7600) TaxID=334819 RepID=W7MRP8_GIBM7|nr:hypothetical protein FVEG_12120 [Fusarium verticillioides 7600]EWG53761.1 hypothetical protein FVEG_12120 [Fusarium verticillioides 7600]
MYLARPLLSSAGDLYLAALTGMSYCSMCPQDRIIQQGLSCPTVTAQEYGYSQAASIDSSCNCNPLPTKAGGALSSTVRVPTRRAARGRPQTGKAENCVGAEPRPELRAQRNSTPTAIQCQARFAASWRTLEN